MCGEPGPGRAPSRGVPTCEEGDTVTPGGRRPTQVLARGGEAAGVAEEGMSPETPQPKLNLRPQPVDRGQGGRRWEGGGEWYKKPKALERKC